MRCPAHTTNLSATPGRPACPSRASGWSSLTTPWGFPCCVRFPCVHAVANTPVQRLGVFFAHLSSRISLPRNGSRVGLHNDLFEACSAFTRVAACTLALSPICDTIIEGFSHFVTSMTAPIASGWSGCRVGLAPTGKRRLSTAHARMRSLQISDKGDRPWNRLAELGWTRRNVSSNFMG
jgi:hypothetical protein